MQAEHLGAGPLPPVASSLPAVGMGIGHEMGMGMDIDMDMVAWCERFVSAWCATGPELDQELARYIAERSYPHERHLPPELSARAHVALLRRARQALNPLSRLRSG